MNLNDILNERLAIVGGTGSGKSYSARGLVERVLSTKLGRVGIIDPTGVWWGLRLKPDGKSAGFPVVLFGGDHSDVPLLETAGRVIAQAVASTHQSWIIDTSALKSKAAERRFMLDFLDGIFEANREDITLVVDEADRFSPQRMNPESARLHERMEEIVRRGRVRGFTPWLITQRPASLNKDVLSQATAYISMRMTGRHDREAMADVIEGQADKAVAKAIIDMMPRHKVGSGLVWAPQQDILLPESFPTIKTFDSMQAPKPGERRKTKTLPPIDLGALREKMATVEVEAKANDPAQLRRRITELEREKKSAKGVLGASEADLKAAHDRGLHEGLRDGFVSGYNAAQNDASKAIMALDFTPRLGEKKFQRVDIPHTPRAASPPPAAPRSQSASSPSPPRRDAGGNGTALPRGEKACLICAAQKPDGATREQLTVVTGYKRSSRDAYLQRLREKGYIDQQGDRVVATEEGIAALGSDFEPLPTGEALREFHLRRLPEGERRVLEVLISAYPDAVAREVIDETTDYKRSSRDAYLQRLSARQLVTSQGRGEVRASDQLF